MTLCADRFEVLDLIETLWNVKSFQFVQNSLIDLDLIETLWNVKSAAAAINSTASERFNRNIVECKE